MIIYKAQPVLHLPFALCFYNRLTDSVIHSDPTQLKNYRPISKLPLLSKILDKVVADQLTAFLEKRDIYDKFQSGFRKCHSTETALIKVSSDIMMSADPGASTVMVLLDLTSAFDNVDHPD